MTGEDSAPLTFTQFHWKLLQLSHQDRLHKFNEAKDMAGNLLLLIAQQRCCSMASVSKEFGAMN